MEPTSNFPDFGLPEGTPDASVSAVPDRGSDVSHETKTRIRRAVNRQQITTTAEVESEISALRSFSLSRPNKTQFVAIMNPQHRSGKTSLTINLAANLARQGLRVLVLDLSQSVSQFLGSADSSMTQVLRGERKIQDAARPVSNYTNLYFVAADASLGTLELELSYGVSTEKKLERAVQKLLSTTPEWDYILIDTPSSCGMLALNAVYASEKIITPLVIKESAQAYMRALEDLLIFAEENFDKTIEFTGVIQTQLGASEMAITFEEQFAGLEHWHLFETVIPRSKEAYKATESHQIVADEYPYTAADLMYLKCAREINKLFSKPL